MGARPALIPPVRAQLARAWRGLPRTAPGPQAAGRAIRVLARPARPGQARACPVAGPRRPTAPSCPPGACSRQRSSTTPWPPTTDRPGIAGTAHPRAIHSRRSPCRLTPAWDSGPECSVVCSVESADARGNSGGTADIALFRRVVVGSPAPIRACPRLPGAATSAVTARVSDRRFGRHGGPGACPRDQHSHLRRGSPAPGEQSYTRDRSSPPRRPALLPTHRPCLHGRHGGGAKCASSVSLRWPSWT